MRPSFQGSRRHQAAAGFRSRAIHRNEPWFHQFTQGIPSSAVTAPPCAPVVGMATAEDEDEGVAEVVGKAAPAPSMTSTWPAATVELAVAVTLNSEAIVLALADAPAPYSTSVVESALVSEICPAW